ncbi:protein of unknown function [Amycolatopsis marina]|uniref:DUF397 domain-containing protein n=1 Tax=Amycolatopsis marina TaxID=490629 RepID=A0A1I0XIK5_9PSEU|nr:DUF397 domain-containing protein [Amycolatopsis marina]SFB00058.1 protein of unknown function [Amycolatopsis marina]
MPAHITWRRSSYSDSEGQGGNCVEVTFDGPAVGIRDSKSPDSGVLLVSSAVWRGFLAAKLPTRAS